MEKNAVQHLTRILRGLVIAVLIVNILCMFLVPGLAWLLADGGPDAVRKYLIEELAAGYTAHTMGHLLLFFLNCLWAVWLDWSAALLTLFYWLCGLCTATILWQAKKVLDTILAEDPFRMTNARALKRAAISCWVISGGALIRLVLWLWLERRIAPLFTYNALFIPAFGMAGLLFLVMSALFRQAAELKEEQDLTI